MTTPITYDEARDAARRRLPKVLFDYIDSGASAERTMSANVSDLGAIKLQQRVLSSVANRDLRSVMLGRAFSAPLVLGPVGFSGAYRRDGEILVAKAAEQLGIPYCISMFSLSTLGAVKSAVPDCELLAQVYLTKDASIHSDYIRQATDVGIDVLCVTVDTCAGGFRPKDLRNGLRGATRLSFPMLKSFLMRPGWCLDMARADGGLTFPAVSRHASAGTWLLPQGTFLSSQIDRSITWDSISALRASWPGKLIIKGILHPDDAAKAAAVGADAIVVSNHGGRQVDSITSSISRVGAIAAAVSGRVEIMFDSGIRSGGDAVKALALGASSVWIGRPYAFALAANGLDGVLSLMTSFVQEMSSSLGQMGLSKPSDVKAEHICPSFAFEG